MVMVRRDPTVLLALFVALAAHLLILGMGVRTARHELGWWLQGAGTPAHAATPAVTAIPPPPPNDPMLGDHNTHGTAINNSPGERPLESSFAVTDPEQAAMQRDPAGYGGKGSAHQLEQALRGNNGNGGQSGASAQANNPSSVFASREAAVAQSAPRVNRQIPVKASENPSNGQGDIDPLSSGPNEMRPPSTAPAQSAQANAAHSQSNNSATGTGGQPGSAEPGAGNPIPTSDFESFPVTHIASRMVAGHIEAQTGRKVRTIDPKFGESSRADLAVMENSTIVMLLQIDETGAVTDVKIEHSSGSDSVDLDCQRAMYSWWFEPLKDPKTNKPRGEQMEFTIRFL